MGIDGISKKKPDLKKAKKKAMESKGNLRVASTPEPAKAPQETKVTPKVQRMLELELLRGQRLIANFIKDQDFLCSLYNRHIITFHADFLVLENDGSRRVEMVQKERKGCELELFVIQCKLMEAVHNIHVVEV